jgi:hypothetical protein
MNTRSRHARSRQVVQMLLATLALSLAAAPAVAIPVQFIEVGTAPIGFSSSNFPTPVDILLPLNADVRPVSIGAVADGFGLSMSTCFLINEFPGSGCQAFQPAGSTGFTLIVDITLLTVPTGAADKDSLIFFSALPPVPSYSVSDVSVIVNDLTPIPGFTLTPFTTASFTPAPSMTYYYLGFVLREGESATFRVDVTGDHSMAGSPLIFAANGYVVPEPGTALLVGLGLVALAYRRSR